MDLARRQLFAAAAATPFAMAASQSLASTSAPPPLLGPAPGVALLSRNENPYGPAPSAKAAIVDGLPGGAYYADVAVRRLAAMIAEKNGVTPEHVVISSGSGEVLNAAAMVYGRKGPLVGAELFWDAYFGYAARAGIAVRRVPLLPTLYNDLAGMEAAAEGAGMVAVCNPNNPTGLLENADALHAFCKRASAKTFVLVDEAYNELTDNPGGNSIVDLIREGANVGVARTFSKVYGMAGLRVGYMITNPQHASTIRDALMSSMNGMGLAAAVASYNDEGFIAYSRARIKEGREMVLEAARAAGLRTLASQTNFVWVDVGQDANIVQRRLAEKQIMVRGVYGKWTNWSRVSMGRLEDVERYCRALPEAVRA